MWISCPWINYILVYGWGCGIIGSFNIFMIFNEIRFFWLPFSTKKCIGVPFTHICEWKRCSSSYGFSSPSSCIVLAAMVVLGYTSMICFTLLCFESEFELGFDSFSLSSTNYDYFEQNSSMLCQRILWNSHNFIVSLFDLQSPFLTFGTLE
jgi:hypothetical protein